MKPNIDYTLYLVTDRDLMSTPTLEEAVEQAITGGCTLVQLREKDTDSRNFYCTALQVKKITHKYNIPFIINDRLDIALAVDADGVHIGHSDLPASVVRRIIGPDKILGVSTSTLEQALQAKADGADYLGVGAMFTTSTKLNAASVKLETLEKIKEQTALPVVAIGGINAATLPQLKGSSIDGIAVVSAIIASNDITNASRQMKELFLQCKNS